MLNRMQPVRDRTAALLTEPGFRSWQAKWSGDPLIEGADGLTSLEESSWPNLLSVRLAMASSGRHGAANEFRHRAQDLVMESVSHGSRVHFSRTLEVWLALLCTIERDDLSRAEALMQMLERASAASFRNRPFPHLLRVAHELWSMRNLQSSWIPRFRVDAALLQALEGRRIALVGPAESREDTGPEIDAHDLVVRMNATQGNQQGRISSHGSRVDIVSYSGWDGRDINAGLSTPPIESRLLVTAVRIRSSKDQSPLVFMGPGFSGSPFHVQRLLFHLLLANPRSIKIYCVSFFSGPYVSNYDSSYGGIPLRHLDLARHDLAENFLLMQTLLKTGRVELDASATAIMSLTLPAYLASVEAFQGLE